MGNGRSKGAVEILESHRSGSTTLVLSDWQEENIKKWAFRHKGPPRDFVGAFCRKINGIQNHSCHDTESKRENSRPVERIDLILFPDKNSASVDLGYQQALTRREIDFIISELKSKFLSFKATEFDERFECLPSVQFVTRISHRRSLTMKELLKTSWNNIKLDLNLQRPQNVFNNSRNDNYSYARVASEYGMSYLVKSLALLNLSCLSELHLQRNSINDHGLDILCTFISNESCRLQVLNLAHNFISHNGVTRLSKALVMNLNCVIKVILLHGNLLPELSLKNSKAIMDLVSTSDKNCLQVVSIDGFDSNLQHEFQEWFMSNLVFVQGSTLPFSFRQFLYDIHTNPGLLLHCMDPGLMKIQCCELMKIFRIARLPHISEDIILLILSFAEISYFNWID